MEKEAFISEKHDEIAEKESGVAEAIAKKQEISEQIIEKSVERSGVTKDIEVFKDALERLSESVASANTNLSLHESEINDIVEKNKALEEDIVTKTAETEQGSELLKELDEKALVLEEEKKQFDEKDWDTNIQACLFYFNSVKTFLPHLSCQKPF